VNQPFPVLDYDRGEDIDGMHRLVLDAGQVTVSIDEAGGEWITLPFRSVHVQSMGPRFELGPYAISGPDAINLINALARYGQTTGEFKLLGTA